MQKGPKKSVVNISGYEMELVEGYVFPNSDDLFSLKSSIDRASISLLLQKIRDAVRNDQVVLQHPLLGVETKACYSLPLQPNANAIFFASSDETAWWVAIQINNFIDAIVLPGKVYLLPKRLNKRLVLNQVGKLLDLIGPRYNHVSRFLSKRLGFKGFSLGFSRPFHSFYDQLMYLEPLSGVGLLEGRELSVFNDVFFDVRKIAPGVDVVNHDPDRGVYLNVSFIRALSFQSLNIDGFNKLARSFEERVLSSSLQGDHEELRNVVHSGVSMRESVRNRLGLWIGITGQKRSWMQQVEGCSEIIKRISGYFDEVDVFLDGMTSPVDRMVNNKQDAEVCWSIKERCGEHAGVTFIEVVGKSYEEKVRLCHKFVDFFIANAGTGSVVPLRFCRKPGVLHSNSSLMSFPDDYGRRIKMVAGDDVLDCSASDAVGKDRVSYYAAWEIVFNHLAELINDSKEGGVMVEPVRQYLPYGELDADGVSSAMRQLDNSLVSAKGSADVLREVALFYENVGEIDHAFRAMHFAATARPNGPFIKRKLAEYAAVLEQYPKGGRNA
ncbi:MAG: hypothetical protein ACQETX_14890 [Pseudomonadota bacterium]